MRRAFTLVEMMVVLAIVSILAGILLPVISGARKSAARAACRAQLRQVGASFQLYLNDNRGRLPRINTMPSFRPPLSTAPALPDLLQAPRAVYQCRADQITRAEPGTPEGYDTYFQREGSSYQYNTFLAAAYPGRTFSDTEFGQQGMLYALPVLWEYEAFHGTPSTPGAMNYLFSDWHVGDLEEYRKAAATSDK